MSPTIHDVFIYKEINRFHMSTRRIENFPGEFRSKNDVYQSIIDEAERVPKRETGGMMFGSLDESGDHLTVTIEKVAQIPDAQAQRTAAHFGIEPEYADRVLDKFCPEYTYLGSWHSHLNYGGPSQGDYQQVSRFFETNENRDWMIAMIMDRKQLNPPEFVPIPEVYKRDEHSQRGYTIERVEEIKLYDTPEISEHDTKIGELISNLDLRSSLLTKIHSIASDLSEETAIMGDHADANVYLDQGGSIEEIVLCLPIKYRGTKTETGIRYENFSSSDNSDRLTSIDRETDSSMESQQIKTDAETEQSGSYHERLSGEDEDQNRDTDEISRETDGSDLQAPSDDGNSINSQGDLTGKSIKVPKFSTEELELYLKISVPISYPADKIYVDIASRDFTRQLTVYKAQSIILEGGTKPLVSDIEQLLNSDIPKLLINPLAVTMQGETT